MINSDEDDFEPIEKGEDISNGNAVKVKKEKEISKSNKIHREVTTKVGNGYQTIEITEMHIGHTPGDHNKASHGVPTIIIGKPKNLKMRGQHASPFQMFQAIDELFDSIFEDMTNKLILDHISHSKPHTNDVGKNNNDLEVKDEEDHSHHLKVTDVKDVTNEKPDSKIDNQNQVHIEPAEKKIEEKEDTEHGLAISYANSDKPNKDDNVMTPRQKRKQIKEERRRNLFSQACKYVFYVLVLFSFYLVGKKLMQWLGLIPENIQLDSKAEANGIPESSTVELKTGNMKHE